MYEETLVHEIVGHLGVQKVFGNEYKQKLQALFNALGGLEGIRKIAKNNGVDMQQFESAYIQPYTQAAKDGKYTEVDVQQALVGEMFAFVAQNQINRPIAMRKLKELVGYVRQWLREHGFSKLLAKHNDADVMMYLAKARKALIDPSLQGGIDGVRYSRKANSEQSEIDAIRKQYQNTPQWMKAPNGKDTNLSERQWLQVRTPSFKKWFGDWEASTAHAVLNGEPVATVSKADVPDGGIAQVS